MTCPPGRRQATRVSNPNSNCYDRLSTYRLRCQRPRHRARLSSRQPISREVRGRTAASFRAPCFRLCGQASPPTRLGTMHGMTTHRRAGCERPDRTRGPPEAGRRRCAQMRSPRCVADVIGKIRRRAGADVGAHRHHAPAGPLVGNHAPRRTADLDRPRIWQSTGIKK